MFEGTTDVGPSLKAYSRERPLALITDYPPDAPGGGAVILRSLLDETDRERVLWISPEPPASPIENAVAPRPSTTRPRSIVRDSTIGAGTLAKKIIEIARDRGARAFWIVAHGSAVAIAARLVRVGGLPVHLTVHDDPAFANALRSRRYLALVPWIERDFAFAMRRAKSIDVICEAMADRYRKRYGVSSVVVHRGLDRPIAPSPAYDRERLGLRIGVLGSTYSYDQLPILSKAIAGAAKRLNVAGRLLVLGKSHGERLKREIAEIEIEVGGHVDEAEAVPLLQECFALYLNYPFGRRDATLRRTSFPTKLSTYVQAARPLLLHVPIDGSVVPLTELGDYATLWDAPDATKGADRLISLWNAPESFASAHEAAETVRRRYYDRERHRRTLFEALNALVLDENAP